MHLSRTVFKNFVFLFCFFAAWTILNNSAKAQEEDREYFYKNINQEFLVNKDSTISITEEYTLNFYGTFRGVSRGITIENASNLEKCRNNSSLQCGGFNFMYIEGVYDGQGRKLDESEYTVALDTYETGEKRIEVRYQFSKDGEEFNREDFKWSIKYKVFGGLGFFTDYDLFYWNLAFADRDVNINAMTSKIVFPQDFTPKLTTDLRTFETGIKPSFENKTLTIQNTSILYPGDSNTIIFKFPKKIVDQPASIEIKPTVEAGFLSPLFSVFPPEYSLVVEGRKIFSNGNKYLGLPTGKNDYTFTTDHYSEIKTTLDLKPGENYILEAKVYPSPFIYLVILIIILLNCCGCLMFLGAFIIPVYRWYTTGRDSGKPKTIVPWFSPPDDITPALMGSIKDEHVDLVDISATIINVAFKGYIKIREIRDNKEFEFEKLKPFDDLPAEELQIMNQIFANRTEEEKVSTKDLKNTFYSRIPTIQNSLYDSMVSKGYFKKRPDKIREENYALGAFCIFVPGIFISFAAPVTGGLALLFCLPITVSLGIFGVMTLIFANAMPAKTELGRDILERLWGFRMYLNAAERYTLQKLTPETFEKYLSYAMVFGIEKEWAEKFKDIYKGQPEWYEGADTGRIWTPIYLANSMRSFTNSTSSVISSKPQSSSSDGWSSGGWSGGGGFSGGFSGGGGGGGGGGAW